MKGSLDLLKSVRSLKEHDDMDDAVVKINDDLKARQQKRSFSDSQPV